MTTTASRRFHRWTEPERELIRTLYEGNRQSLVRISRILGVSPAAVKGQIQALGLARIRRTLWTPAEIEILQELAPRYSVRTIAHKLHRSLNSVTVKLKRLHVSRRLHEGWFTAKEVAEILGVEQHKVKRWIDCGCLAASWHNGHKPGHDGLSMWHITSADLRSFIVRYCNELSGRNVDLQLIIWIVTGEV